MPASLPKPYSHIQSLPKHLLNEKSLLLIHHNLFNAMGYYVELLAGSEELCTFSELLGRAHEAGAVQHPDDLRSLYHTGFGTIQRLDDEAIGEGRWGWIRISYAAKKDIWIAVLDFAAQMGGRIYDDSTKAYVTLESISDVYAAQLKGLGLVTRLFGRARTSDTSEDTSTDKR